MKNKTLFFSFILSLFFINSTFAQNKFEQGFIVTNNLDTLRGLIKNKEWEITPEKIEFKTNTSTEVKEYTFADIHSFQINNESIYISKKVEADQLPIKDQTVSWEEKPQFITQHIFLKLIVGGNVPLYLLWDKNGKKHFFIEKDGEINELLFIRHFERHNVIREKRIYIGQLNLYLNDCPDVRPLIAKAKYKQQSLTKIFTTYNNCFGPKKVTFKQKKEKVKFQFGVLAGVTLTKLNFRGSNPARSQFINLAPSVNYAVGGTVDIVFPRFDQRFTLRNELLFKPYKQSDETTLVIDEDQNSILTAEFDLAYLRFYNIGEWKLKAKKKSLFILAGFSNSYALKNKNNTNSIDKFFSQVTTRDVPSILFYRKYEIGFITGLGYLFNNFTIDLKYEIGNGISKELGLGSNTHTAFLMLKYTF